ncbi:hypothetical protein EVJ58_g8284 [Rhodofomes roseus]|uniref:Uncharacterized protein n=1 Tax=Rhodofomes roseus TaxID=34475 RepID=A0A4Y9Y0E0_9APHY|nr:hypothetical protein EVJ58_g8284 [Rhodofomes roseus]
MSVASSVVSAGAASSSTGAPVPAAPTLAGADPVFTVPARRKQPASRVGKTGRERDLITDLLDRYGSREQVIARSADFDRIHVRPIQPNTQYIRNRARRLWLAYWELVLGSKEAAEATIAPGAPFPPLDKVKHCLHTIFTAGKSYLESGKGWSLDTARTFLGHMLGDRAAAGARMPTKSQRTQLTNAIYEWAVKDKLLSTRKRQKYIMREPDLVAFCGAALRTTCPLDSGWLRLLVVLLALLLYATGQRLGAIVLAAQYTDTMECLCFKHIEIWITGWTEGVGLDITVFIEFHHMKYMRQLESSFMRVSLRSHDRSHLVNEVVTPLIAMGLARNAFVDKNVLAMFRDIKNVPGPLPYRLHWTPEFKDQPVFTMLDRTAPATTSAAAHWLKKPALMLGWTRGFSSRVFRYTFARTLAHASGVHDFDLNYLMGHVYKGTLAKNAYQHPDRPVDVTALLFSQQAQLDMIHWHSSVAFDPDRNGPPPSASIGIVLDQQADTLLKSWHAAEEIVKAAYDGKLSHELDEELMAMPHVEDALNKRLLAIQYLASLQTTKHWQNFNSHSAGDATSSAGPSRDDPCLPTVPPAGDSGHDAGTSTDDVSGTALPGLAIGPDAYAAAHRMLATVESPHPFIAVINAEKHNPRAALLEQYLALVKADDLRKQGICPWCHEDESLPEKKRTANHSQRLATHMWGCDEKHHPDFTRCPICATFFELPFDDESMEDHYAACLRGLLLRHGHLEPTDEERADAQLPDVGSPDDDAEDGTAVYDSDDEDVAARMGQVLQGTRLSTAANGKKKRAKGASHNAAEGQATK